MQDYLDFKALLENELSELENINIDEIVERRVAEYRNQVQAEELANKDSAIAKKQAEIDAVNRIMARLQQTIASEENQTEE